MDASQYKDYVLVLLFMKYVSDKGDKLVDIPEGAGFRDMVKLRGQPDIGDRINKIIGALAKANELSGIITVADFNDDEKLGKGKDKIDRLSNLIDIFNRPELDFSSNRAENDDLLGDAYEYLMRHFATESGKSKGQFYTPAEVSRIMAQVIGMEHSASQSETLYDPTCGSGSLLLKAADEAPHGISIYGQENDNATRALAVMNMWLHGNPSSEIAQGNTLADPRFFDERSGHLKAFDYAVANPPFSNKSWSNGLDAANDIFRRFEGYGIPPAKNGDYTFLLHFLKSLKSTGRGAIILPLGVLFRGNAEATIRRAIVERGYLKGIIGLPANLFYGTGIAACILVVDKAGATDQRSIFMIDASRGYTKDGNKNRLRARDIHRMVDVFNRQTEAPGYSRLVPFTEMASDRNDFNLNLPRYIDSQEAEDTQDIEAHLRGGLPERDVAALDAYWSVYPGLKDDLLAPARPHYWRLQVPRDELKVRILAHPEFVGYAGQLETVFTTWRDHNTAYLKTLSTGCLPKTVIHTLAEDLLTTYADRPLVDRYAVYQHLMDYWGDPMQDDLYELAAEGWAAGNVLIRLSRATKKGQQDVGGLEGLAGLLIPVPLVVAHYFAPEQAHIDQLQAELDAVVAERDELAEEHGSDEEGALYEVSSRAEAQRAQEEYTIQAGREYLPDSYPAFEALQRQHHRAEATLTELRATPYLAALMNDRGSVTQGEVKRRLATVPLSDEQPVLEQYLATLKQATAYQKKIKAHLARTLAQLQPLMQQQPEADGLRELRVLLRYQELLEQETQAKAEIRQALAELEKKVVAKYPALREAEVKTLVVDKKWMTALEERVRTEMEAISHRLTGRLQTLADRYATPLPELAQQVTSLESRVQAHLEKMGFAIDA